jgi:hypothetical protein
VSPPYRLEDMADDFVTRKLLRDIAEHAGIVIRHLYRVRCGPRIRSVKDCGGMLSRSTFEAMRCLAVA